MSKFETAFKAAIAENERRILISTLLASPDLTLGELHKLSKGSLGRLFSEITISDLISGGGGAISSGASAGVSAPRRGPKPRGAAAGAAAGGAPKGRGAAAKAAAPAAPPEAAPAAEAKGRGGAVKVRGGKAKAVNTRTAEGRTEYDEALFQAVKEHGGPVGAGALIAKVGGTSLQARAGLARLIEAGRITWSGKARGTKYSVL
jgi:hypothetical protein